MFVIPFIIFLITFLSIAISIFRAHRHAGGTVKDIINTVSAYAEQHAPKEVKPVEPQTKICEYCGATIDAKATKCNACGARAKGNKYNDKA